jgi:hypothetical protein
MSMRFSMDSVRVWPAVLALLLPPASGWAQDQATRLAKAPPLPDGRLLAVATQDLGATFLLLDQAFKANGQADVWTFEVFDPAMALGENRYVVQGVSHHQIDCAAHTDHRLASIGYDEAGTALVAVDAAPATPLETGGAYSLIAKVVCDAVEPNVSQVVLGHAAALAAARALIQAEKDAASSAPQAVFPQGPSTAAASPGAPRPSEPPK